MQTNIFTVNNLRCVHIPTNNTGVIFCCMATNAGAFIEQEKSIPGVAHFLEHMLCKGTKSFPTIEDIYKNIDFYGSESNATTGFIDTKYYTTTVSLNSSKAITYTLEQFFAPQLSNKVFDNEKKIILEEARKAYSSSEKKTRQFVIENLYKTKRAKYMVLGDIKTIEKIQYSDVLDFYKKYYTTTNSIFFIYGDISKENAIKNILENSHIFRSKKVTIPKIPSVVINGKTKIKKTKERKNSFVSICYTGAKIKDKDIEIYNFIQTMLGLKKSPLLKKLRYEKGLVYSINTNWEQGGMVFNFETQKGNEKMCINLFKKCMQDIANYGVENELFELTKNQIMFRKKINESNIAKFGLYYSGFFLRNNQINSVEEHYKILEKIEKSHVNKIFKKIVKTQPSILIVK